MAGVVDAGEGEVSVLADDAADVGAVDDDLRVAGGVEGGCAGRLGGDGEGDRLPAEPVADVVAVAVDEGDAHAEGEEVGHLRDLVAAVVVAGCEEGGGNGAVGLSVVDGCADGGLDVGGVEVFEVGAWREWICCGLRDVVDVPS